VSLRNSEARTADLAAVGLPTALAAVLCLVQIAGRSIGFDEAATVTIAAQHGSALGSAIAHDGGNMSGYYLLLHVLMAAFGNGELLIRLPSALASVATVALIGAIGLRLFGRRAAFAAGLLTAVSLPLVFWAQNARGYALMVAFVSAAYLVIVPLAAPEGGRHRRPERPGRRWVAYGVLMTLAIYSSFVAVLVLPAQLLALLAGRQTMRLRQFAGAWAGIALLCVPLLVLAVRRGAGQLFWVPRPTRKLEVQVLQSLTSAGQEPSFHPTSTTTALMVLTGAVLLAMAIAIVRVRPARDSAWGWAMAGGWVVVPVAIALVYSLVSQPVFLPRNLLMSVPAMSLLLGAGIGDVRLTRRAAPAALALLVVLVGLRALQLVPSYGVSPEPWQRATGYVLARARSGDCIAFYPLDARMAFQYYVGTGTGADRRAPRSILPNVRWGVVRPYVEDYSTLSPAQIAGRSPGCARLWFVSSHEGQPDGPAQSRANRARFLKLRVKFERAFGGGRVRQFGYASTVHVQLLVKGAGSSRRR
jgi:mannosyltransferase